MTKINSIEGDALITMVRGKKKFIYDFTISLDWTLLIGEIFICNIIKNVSVFNDVLTGMLKTAYVESAPGVSLISPQ